LTDPVALVKQRLSTPDGISGYVAEAIQEALGAIAVTWSPVFMGIKPAPGPWSWETLGAMTWRIHAPFRFEVPLYYTLMAAVDLQRFVIVHSNHKQGIWSWQWVIETATVVPFSALYLDTGGRESLAEILRQVLGQFPPNYEWPT
jgi:hypothetical protein